MPIPDDTGAKPLYRASLSTMWGIKRFSDLGEFFSAARALGFASVELNHQVTASMLAGVDLDAHPITSIHEPCPATVSADVLKAQDRLISSLDEARRREGVDSIKRSIDLARRLGVGAVVVHSGQVWADGAAETQMRHLFDQGLSATPEYQAIKQGFEATRAERLAPHMQALERSLLELLDYVGGASIRLGLENRYHYLDIPSPDEMAALLQLAGADRLGFVYDVGHATALDRLGFYPHASWLERFSSRMIGTHLHDVLGVSDHRAPGLGEVDFRELAGYLPKDAFRTLELQGSNTPEDIQQGMQILVDAGCVDRIG